MKSTSISNRSMLFFMRKIIPSTNPFKTLATADFLSCLFAGTLSQGMLFGSLKPFGFAFYAAYPSNLFMKVLMLIAIIAGNLFSGDVLSALRQTAVILLYEWIKKLIQRKEQEKELLQNAMLASAATAGTGLLIFVVSGQYVESLLLLVMEVVLVCVATALFSITFYGQDASFRDRYVGQKNMGYFGLLIMGGAFLLGVSGLQIPGVSLDRIMAGTGILMLTRHFGPGFGACAGTIAGLSLATAYPQSLPSLIGIYAISGLTAGMLQKSKIAAGLSFFFVQFLFLLTVREVYLDWSDIVIPIILFWVIPDLKKGKLIVLRNYVSGETMEEKKMDKVRMTLSKRLESMSIALCRMAHTVDKQINGRVDKRGEVAGAVMEQLTQQVCSFCGKSSTCWETKLFFTYKTMNTLIDSLQSHHVSSSREVEQELNRFCVKSGAVIDALLRIIELKRIDRVWQETVVETQNAIPGQIFCVSEILTKISQEILQANEIFGEEEKKLMTLLRKNGFPVYELDIRRGANGKFMVTVNLEECKGYQNCSGQVARLVSQVLGVQMLVEEGECKAACSSCSINLKEKENMGITTGIARIRKDKAKVSGDSFTFLKTWDGKYIAAISDGMGSGREANRLSETAIGLFEQLLDCGLSVRLSLSLVNMMIEISSPEKYATMDVSSIDLYTGETEFYKLGAMPSLIINGRNIDYIQIDNLPAGLQQKNAITFEKRKITDGEFIIMMTDGAFDKLANGDENTLLEKVIRLNHTLNPQELAEHILSSACKGSNSVCDDMTVLVAKLWCKAG
jgi:stage II sporulation protein E